MAKKELEYFMIGNSYGGNQEWFSSFMMRLGGCGAESACDCSIYFSRVFGRKSLYPFDDSSILKSDYVSFSRIMEPYLRPRRTGINTLDIYMDGYGAYLADKGETSISMRGLRGESPYETARDAVRSQIDRDIPVVCLTLYHSNRRFKDYQWHWYILNGYDECDGEMGVKAVTYSEYEWLDLRGLWDTGRMEKGGLVLFDVK